MQPFSCVVHRHIKAIFDHHQGRRCFLEVQIALVILHIVFSLVSKESCAQSRAMKNPNMWRIHVQEILCAGKTWKPGLHASNCWITPKVDVARLLSCAGHVSHVQVYQEKNCIRKKVLHAHMSHTHQLLAGEWCSIPSPARPRDMYPSNATNQPWCFCNSEGSHVFQWILYRVVWYSPKKFKVQQS